MRTCHRRPRGSRRSPLATTIHTKNAKANHSESRTTKNDTSWQPFIQPDADLSVVLAYVGPHLGRHHSPFVLAEEHNLRSHPTRLERLGHFGELPIGREGT